MLGDSDVVDEGVGAAGAGDVGVLEGPQAAAVGEVDRPLVVGAVKPVGGGGEDTGEVGGIVEARGRAGHLPGRQQVCGRDGEAGRSRRQVLTGAADETGDAHGDVLWSRDEGEHVTGAAHDVVPKVSDERRPRLDDESPERSPCGFGSVKKRD